MNVVLMNQDQQEKSELKKTKQDLKDQSLFFYAIATLLIIVIGGGTVFYRIVEEWEWLDSFYYTMVTMSTVGYGDFVPTQTSSKIFTICLIVFGIAVFATFIAQLLKRQWLKSTLKVLSITHKPFEKGADITHKIKDNLHRKK